MPIGENSELDKIPAAESLNIELSNMAAITNVLNLTASRRGNIGTTGARTRLLVEAGFPRP